MTTEDDFQRALDMNNADWQTRLVFADWLQERDDLRAEGYRALGVLRLYPNRRYYCCSWKWVWGRGCMCQTIHTREAWPWLLGELWWRHVYRIGLLETDVLDYGRAALLISGTRRLAEDCAAIAFARLPKKKRVYLAARMP